MQGAALLVLWLAAAPISLQAMHAHVEEHRPGVIYIGGKACTGKTSLARALVRRQNYRTVDLDQIVRDEVVRHVPDADRRAVFFDVYKARTNMAWVRRFVRAASAQIAKKKPYVVVEGPVGAPDTLAEVFAHEPDFTFVYLHPKDLGAYVERLTKRFLLSRRNLDAAELPQGFWTVMRRDVYAEFHRTGELSPAVQSAIRRYAELSQRESLQRLEEFRKHFHDIIVVDI